MEPTNLLVHISEHILAKIQDAHLCSFGCFVFPAVARPPWQNHPLRMYMTNQGRSASFGSRDTSQGRWAGPVAVIWLPAFVARLVRQVRLILTFVSNQYLVQNKTCPEIISHKKRSTVAPMDAKADTASN